MIKTIAISSIVIASAMVQSNTIKTTSAENAITAFTDTSKNIYGFKVTSLDGNTIDFASFKGKKNTDRKYSFRMRLHTTV